MSITVALIAVSKKTAQNILILYLWKNKANFSKNSSRKITILNLALIKIVSFLHSEKGD